MATTSANRTKIAGQQYSAPEFQKSGFNLGYNKYSTYQMGKIHVSGFQWIMPGDKVSGVNKTNLTAHRIVTPMVTPIDISQYNFFLPLRALDTSFVDGMTPSKNNDMSSSWSAPMTSLRKLVDNFLSAFVGKYSINDIEFSFVLRGLSSYVTSEDDIVLNSALSELGISSVAFIGFLNSYSDGIRAALGTDFKNHYLEDALNGIIEYYDSFSLADFAATNPLVSDFLYQYLTAIFTPFFGRYSYLAELGLPYLRPSDFYNLSHGIVPIDVVGSFVSVISDVPFNEYPLRFMYVLWYERFRDVNLEPVSDTLPKWRQFGSTPVITPVYCVYRFRSWYNDMFVSAQPDDMSRHVFAPILNESAYGAKINDSDPDNLDAQGLYSGSSLSPNNIKSVKLSWRDSLSGEQRSLFCPVPANINDALSANSGEDYDVLGLSLQALRQSKMLERYLKRNYLFGDEYQDRMLAHYNSRVSDMRINRPELLSSSLDSVDFEQEVSNVSTEETKVGDRTATATGSAGSDSYAFFAEEFGLLVNILTIMPRAQYDGVIGQSLLCKQVDFPLPEFAANNEEFGRVLEVADTGLHVVRDGGFGLYGSTFGQYIFGHYPAYHAWRERVDMVGGEFLNELQNATFRRFFGMTSDFTTPKLNYMFIHCLPNLEMFANTVRYDGQFYGDTVHDCFVERVLPTPVEVI